MPLTLYHVDWCPECAVVREKLEDLNLPYDGVIVPDFRPSRQQVFEVSGQYYVPVLRDGETVLTETREILAYLDKYRDEQRSDAPPDRVAEERGDGDDFPTCTL
jgi:mycoredoxin